jgi:tRNA(adenine34) deaminase
MQDIMPYSDEYFMRLALQQAQYAFEAAEIPIGAVLVIDNKIIARDHNRTEQLNDATAHAEMLVLTAAFAGIGAKYLPGATLYVTVEPCLMCCGALYWSKLDRIVYGAEDEKNGYRRSTGANWPFHPKTLLTPGVLAYESAALMKEFFRQRR